MDGVTIHQLQCFDAVVSEGGFQAGAEKLRRSHSTVFTAIKNLESQLGLRLLDRDGYRVALTEAGKSFHDRTRVFLHELSLLQNHARQLAMGEESELQIVIGDPCPLPEVLGFLRQFFDSCPTTHLNLHFEAITGPWERLFDDEADLIIHHIDKSDPRLEFIDLFAGISFQSWRRIFCLSRFPIGSPRNKCAIWSSASSAIPRGTRRRVTIT
jgi:DNA-binding transcriptional LysR family regulator